MLWCSAWGAIANIKLGRLAEAQRLLDGALGTAARRARDANDSYPRVYPLIALSQLRLAKGEAALAAGKDASALAEQTHLGLEQGAAHRALGQAYAAKSSREEAGAAFQRSLEILDDIQSRPELAQSLLAYGSFLVSHEPAKGARFLDRALGIFEDIGATGWVEETRAVFNASS